MTKAQDAAHAAQQAKHDQQVYEDAQAAYDKAEADKAALTETVAKESKQKIETAKFVAVKDAVGPEDHGYFSQYPFDTIGVGEGFFVANEDVKNDALTVMRKEIFRARNYYSIVEHDEDGHEVQEEETGTNQLSVNESQSM